MARLPLWALALVPARLFGQNAASDVHSPAATYLERYQEISNLAPLPGRVAEVNHLVLSRDVGRLILERGTLYLLTPVGGRTVAALFRGEGRFGFAPDTPAERAELQRFAGSPVLEDTLTEAILIFSDSTAEQLGALAFRRCEPRFRRERHALADGRRARRTVAPVRASPEAPRGLGALEHRRDCHGVQG